MDDVTKGYLPPRNLEAEESLLSAILIDDQAGPLVADILQPSDFYTNAHKKIFSAMLPLIRDRRPVDVVTLCNALKERGELDAVGGPAYIGHLVDAVPMSTNAVHHAQIVADKALKRLLIEICLNAAALCAQDKGAARELLDAIQRQIMGIVCGGADAFVAMSRLIMQAVDRYEEIHERQETITGVPSGFSRLDRLTCGFQPGDLIVLAGRPGMGKSALAGAFARHAAQQGFGCAVFSLEMSAAQLTDRLVSAQSGVNGIKLRCGGYDDGESQKIIQAADQLFRLKIFVDETPALHFREVMRRARKVAQDGARIIFVDYMQLVAGDARDGRVNEIRSVSGSLKAMAKELRMPVVALSQLNRDVEKRPVAERTPRLSDLKESGSIEQDADVVLFINRPGEYDTSRDPQSAELIIAKQRCGPTGYVKLRWIPKTQVFEQE